MQSHDIRVYDLPYRASSRPRMRPVGPAPEMMTGWVAALPKVLLHRRHSTAEWKASLCMPLSLRADHARIFVFFLEPDLIPHYIMTQIEYISIGGGAIDSG